MRRLQETTHRYVSEDQRRGVGLQVMLPVSELTNWILSKMVENLADTIYKYILFNEKFIFRLKSNWNPFHGSYWHQVSIGSGKCFGITKTQSVILFLLLYVPREIRLRACALQWRHNECGGVSNQQPHHCLINRLFRRRFKENIKAPRHGPLFGEFTSGRWIPHTNGQ